MRRLSLALLSTLALLAIGAGYLYVTAAPVRDLYSAEIAKEPKAGADLTENSAIAGAARRARLDYFVRPIETNFGRNLTFMRAVKCPPDDYYIFFSVGEQFHTIVLYRSDGASGRPVWKGLVFEGS